MTTSIEGKSAFPENHPLSLGSGGRANPRAVKRFLADADVILGVGCSFAVDRVRRRHAARARRSSTPRWIRWISTRT